MKKFIATAIVALASLNASALLNTSRITFDQPNKAGWYSMANINTRAEVPNFRVPPYKSPFGIFQYQQYPFHFVNATFDGGRTVYKKLLCASGKLIGWEKNGANDAYCFGVTKGNKVELIELLTHEEMLDSQTWPMVALRGHHYEDISLKDLRFKDVCLPYSGLDTDDCFYPDRDFPKKAETF